LLRAGKNKSNLPNIFNKEDVGYIQIKHGLPELITETVFENQTIEILLPSENEIVITQQTDQSYLITVKDMSDGTVILEETEDGVQDVKNKVRDLIKVYDRYILNTKIDGFESIPSVFNNKETITERIEKTITKTTNTSSGSVINVVADKINFVSHQSTKNFNLTDQLKYITPEDQLDINTNNYSVILGEELLTFLRLIQSFIRTHSHPYPNMSPTKTTLEEQILKYDLDSLLSKHITVSD